MLRQEFYRSNASELSTNYVMSSQSLTCLVDEELVLSSRGIGRSSHGTYRNRMDTLGPLLLQVRSSEVSALR